MVPLLMHILVVKRKMKTLSTKYIFCPCHNVFENQRAHNYSAAAQIHKCHFSDAMSLLPRGRLCVYFPLLFMISKNKEQTKTLILVDGRCVFVLILKWVSVYSRFPLLILKVMCFGDSEISLSSSVINLQFSVADRWQLIALQTRHPPPNCPWHLYVSLLLLNAFSAPNHETQRWLEASHFCV